jgi:hypothetical protein
MTHSSRSLRRQRLGCQCLLVLVLGLGLDLGGASAQPVGEGGQGRSPRLTPEQKARVFPDLRRLALNDHRARIRLLEQGERCINGAGSAEALQGCMRREREQYRSLREQHRSEVKQLFQRNGLPVPSWERGGRGPGGGAGGGGGYEG